MKISELMQYQMDFDWFIIGSMGEIIHLTSCGGPLPERVKESLEDLEFLCYYFENKPILNKNQRFNKFGFESYARMAARGLFSYERIDNEDTIYRKVYSPDNYLEIKKLDTEIINLLEGLKLEISPLNTEIIDITKLINSVSD